VLASPFKSKSRLAAENAVLRRQLIVCVPKNLIRIDGAMESPKLVE
jgi:hypothetical protein